jgi:hypothetical protein
MYGTQDVLPSTTMNIVRGGANTMAAVIKEDEAEMDPNIQLVQGNVDRVADGLSELRADVREVRAKQEADTRELRDRIDALDTKMDRKFEALRDTVTALNVKLESSLRKLTIGWFLTIGGILGVMAKGFHWI